MPLIEVIAIAIGLAMDAFAVSVAAGAGSHVRRPRPAIRLSFHLGLFQALMPVIGWYLGSRAMSLVASVDHWIAFALLAFVGGRMIVSWFSPDNDNSQTDPSKGLTMVSLSVACSIDALAIGISLGVLDVSIWTPAVLIGLVTGILSVIGVVLGARFGARYGGVTELLGGVVLIGIGIKILVEHLFV